MAKYKRLGSVTLFDAQNTKEELSKLGNPLERLSQVVDFEMFRKALEDLWNDNSNKKKQKDIDARWTQNGGEDFFGYKVSAKVDGKSKFLKKIAVTAASPHDSKMFPDLMDESDRGQAAFGDSAYVGQEETLQKYG
ncbi:MAG: transposase, partial [Bacteroidales bacterium]|nr:transposase [Bacteroidales bacterium]